MLAPRPFLLVGVFCALALAHGAETVKTKLNLLEAIKTGSVTYFVDPNATPHDAPASIWTLDEDGHLKVSGQGTGYVATQQSYHDYHLVIEYKFVGPTFGSRQGKARSGGALIHAQGIDGKSEAREPASFKVQLMEGSTGDLCGSKASFTAEVQKSSNGDVLWKPHGESANFASVGKSPCVHWAKRDPKWADIEGFAGKNDVQSHYREWTRVEIVAKGDTLQVLVNGVLVNEASKCQFAEGQVALQCDGAEMMVRRWDLYPVGEFKEPWRPILASGGTDVSVRESRETAWSPEKEQAGIVLDGPYEAQLVASEPLVRDPVEITWDAKGRAFVADMMDYPLGAGPGQQPLSRIQMLIDDNHDGHYNRAVTFADHVDHVQGLLPYKDGLIATTRTQILFMRDTKGDGVADEIRPLVEGFNPNHSQLQVASPRWGLDNCVYFNNGLDTKEIYPAGEPDKKQNFTRSNLRWDPFTGKLEPASGFGQYGGSFDDFGRHYYSSNRNPVMMTVMPYEAVIRNPHSGILQGWEDIAPTGADTRVYPLMITHTTADAHAGTHTAACGLGVYRGDLMPELRGEIFVCEPTAQCVVRYHPEPKGASLSATRVGDHKDFFRCWDEWCRPVNVTTGPDGALYVCDIYRRYIDHARFFPEEFVKNHNMRAGDAEGRIWRIVPKGKTARPIEAAPTTVDGLVKWLAHPNAWQRETAQRLLMERAPQNLEGFWKAMAANMDNPDPLFVLHAVCMILTMEHRDSKLLSEPDPESAAKIRKDLTGDPKFADAVAVALDLQNRWNQFDHNAGPKAMTSDSPRLAIFGAISAGLKLDEGGIDSLAKIAVRFPQDVWIQRAILSSASNRSGMILAKIVSDAGYSKAFTSEKSELIRNLASCCAADASSDDFAKLVDTLKLEPDKLSWWKPALLQGLGEGLPKSGSKLGFGSLAALTAKPPAAFKDAAAEIVALQSQVDKVMADTTAPMESHLSVVPLIAQRPWSAAEPVMRNLLADGQPAELRKAALGLLRKFPADKSAPLLYELLPKLDPAARHDVVALLTGNSKTVMDFLHRMETGEVDKSVVTAEGRWGFHHSSNKTIKALAEKLFPAPSADRAALVNQYLAMVGKKGDAAKGHVIFSSICIACHKFKGEGVEVGPDITDVRVKPREALLSDILDPNRMVEARFMAYQIDTKDNRTLVGVVGAETGDAVSLKLPGGVAENVPKANIAKMKCLDQSLMPVGLEAGINQDQMADLMAFLRGEQ